MTDDNIIHSSQICLNAEDKEKTMCDDQSKRISYEVLKQEWLHDVDIVESL